jgi:nitroreductase
MRPLTLKNGSHVDGNEELMSPDLRDHAGPPPEIPNPVIEAILRRSSVSRLVEPGPTSDELDLILHCGANPPDHGHLRPFRFIPLAGKDKDALGRVFLEALFERSKLAGVEPTAGQIEKERRKLERAPLVIAIIADLHPESHVPELEQLLSAGTTAYAMSLAAGSLGYGTIWRTGEVAHDPYIRTALRVASHQQIIGYLYIGTPATAGAPPLRWSDLTDRVATFPIE